MLFPMLRALPFEFPANLSTLYARYSASTSQLHHDVNLLFTLRHASLLRMLYYYYDDSGNGSRIS